MRRKWGLKRPCLLMMVTGGAVDFPFLDYMKDSFKKGLIKTSLSTNAWIISGGLHAGVMKYVGEAVRDYGTDTPRNVVAIGISTLRNLAHHKELKEHIEDSNKSGVPFEYQVTNKCSLDPHHTHFILIDNCETDVEGDNELRAKLLNVLCEENRVNFSVCILLNGGKNSLETARRSLQMGMPVIVLRETGRIAQDLVLALDSER
ncbi:transient receptor potential cation channel subfamily M member 2-like [Diadema antillarum]|uniref:transient receptor potential cation channel subfamily M member 2-like n=1 Tax=Diadema antillarum TaxID=105358 RepID=UPI003A849188